MKFRKKPVTIEAMQLTEGNFSEVFNWVHKGHPPEMNAIIFRDLGSVVGIRTLEGVLWCSIGDWVIKGVLGEFYPCKPDIFELTYEPMEDKGHD